MSGQADVKKGYTRLSYMKIKSKYIFGWGEKNVMVTLNEDIIVKDVDIVPSNNRGNFTLKKTDIEKVSN